MSALELPPPSTLRPLASTGSFVSPTLSSEAVGTAGASSVDNTLSLPQHRTTKTSSASSALTSTCTLNEVAVQISTQVLIPDYNAYYKAPIQQFQMTYMPLADGSLVAGPFLLEIKQGNLLLLFIGMLLMLFLRNSIVSADYIRRGRVKYKGLFYELLASQLLGVATFLSLAASFLLPRVDCRVTMVIEGIFTEISAALLLSGILGAKAYRCLNNSKVVLSVVGSLQMLSSALVILDLARLKAIRRLSRSCAATTEFKFLPLSIALRFVIALFVCLCFIYALVKSSKLPAAQGRISIRLSDNICPEPESEKAECRLTASRSRGWWDYVPESDPCSADPQRPRDASWHVADDQGFIQNLRLLIRSFKFNKSLEESRKPRHEKGLAPMRIAVRFQDSSEKPYFDEGRVSSPCPSQTRSLGRLMDRMRLFREVMRNELAHTAFITLTNVVATVLALIGVFGDLPTSPAFFIGADWAILSLLVIHSFGRVVERHEREAMLQHPSTWDPLYHVEKATNGEVRRALSSISVASNPRRRRSNNNLLDEGDDAPITQDVCNGRGVMVPPPENPFKDPDDIGETSIAGKSRYTEFPKRSRRRGSPTSPQSTISRRYKVIERIRQPPPTLPASHIRDSYYTPNKPPLSPASQYSDIQSYRQSILPFEESL